MDELTNQNDEESQIIREMLSSNEPETRIKARRMRIARHDAFARNSEQSPRLTPSEFQLKASGDIIAELLDDTQFSITNVRRAAIKKEGLRQDSNQIEREEVKELVAKESEIAAQKFQIIDSQWPGISLEKDPLNIHEQTEGQREKCVDLLEQKDSIIDELKLKLKEADSNFFEELLQQNQYVNILSDRINDQINLMGNCYRQELKILENEIESEKNNLIEERRKQWNELASEKEELELGNIKERYELIDQYALNLDSTLIELHEKLRKTRVDCHDKIQDLSLELDTLKNACLINAEKLQYNFYVLQIRRDENYEMKTQQKRTLNRLQDQITGLKEKRMKEVEGIKNEIFKLRKDLRKTTGNMVEIQRRHSVLASTNDKKFFKLWDYNQQAAENSIKHLMEADKCFYEELLGKNWEPPEKNSFKKESMPSYAEAINLLRGENEKLKSKLSNNYENERILKALLESLGENANFLMDDTIEKINTSLTSQDQCLVVADKLFKILGVQNSEEADLMAQIFSAYMKCVTCDAVKYECNETDHREILDLIDQTVKSQMDLIASQSRKESTEMMPWRDVETQKSEVSTEFFELIDENPKFQLQPACKLCSNPGHQWKLEPNSLCQALNEFREKMKECRRNSSIEPTKSLSASRSLNGNEMKMFWCQFTTVFNESKVEVWEALLTHMKDYYKLLLRRQFYNDAIKKLETSNMDLRRLLQRYIKPKDLTAKQLEIHSKFRNTIFDPPLKSLSSLDLS